MHNPAENSLLPEQVKFNLCTRITVIVFWCLALVGVVCSMFLLKDVEQDVIQRRQAVIERFAYRMEWALFDAMYQRGPQDLTQKLESLALRFDVSGAQLHFNNQVLMVGENEPGLDHTTRNIYLNRPTDSQQLTAATLTLYFPAVKEMVSSRRNRVMFTMGTVLLVLGIVLQRSLSQVLTQPMRRMVSIAHAVSEGDTGRRFEDSTDDEFGYLGGFINQALGELSYQASHDPVTGLYNRREFGRVLQRALQTAQRDGQAHALCYLDLDRFKHINDTCGHAAGDEFLAQLSAHLQRHMRKSDVLARLGGDEFGVFLQHCPLSRAVEVAEDLHQTIRDFHFVWEQESFHVGVSIGLVEITSASCNVIQLLNNADNACYAAKKRGRDQLHVYTAGDEEVTRHRTEMALESLLSAALEEDRLRLFFQPLQAVFGSREPEHYELLLRMLDHDGTLLEAEHFVTLAERMDLMPALDRWVIECACRYLNDSCSHGRTPVLMINISGKSLADAAFLTFINQVISQYKIDPACLCFEITELAAITNLAITRRFIDWLHGLGCRFALDNFGRGISSFAHLKSLPADYLKIDGSLVHNIADSEVDRTMVEAINRVGHVLGMKTVSELVHQVEINSVLRELGVDYVQGHLVGDPRPLEELHMTGVIDSGPESLLHQA